MAGDYQNNSSTRSVDSFISVNGELRLNATLLDAPRGIHTLLMRRGDCATSDQQHFDTSPAAASESDRLAGYIRDLPADSVLIGVASFDDRAPGLTPSAVGALRDIGVNVSTLGFDGKLVFAADVRSPSTRSVALLWKQALRLL